MTDLSTEQLAFVRQDVAFLFEETMLGNITESFEDWIEYLSEYCGIDIETRFEYLCEEIYETLGPTIHRKPGRGIPVLCKIIKKRTLRSSPYNECSPKAVFDAYLSSISFFINPSPVKKFDKRIECIQDCHSMIFKNRAELDRCAIELEKAKDNNRKEWAETLGKLIDKCNYRITILQHFIKKLERIL